MKSVTFIIPESVWKKLKQFCLDFNATQSEVATQALLEFMRSDFTPPEKAIDLGEAVQNGNPFGE